MKWLYAILFVFFLFRSHAQISDFAEINFSKADAIALKYKGASLHNLPQLVDNLTGHLTTDVEKFRAIYYWVCTNIINDYQLYAKNSKKRKRYAHDSLLLEQWNNGFKTALFKKLIEEKRTLCTGYAYLVKAMANLANIECEIVHGYGRTSTLHINKNTAPNHSWNAVKLNNKWYLCDPTWASGLINPETYQFKFEYKEGLFLPSPHVFAMNHYPIDETWLLINENPPSFDTFLAAPLIYNKAYTNVNAHLYPTLMHNTIKKNETIIFKYELLEHLNTPEVSFMIDDGKTTITTKPLKTHTKDRLLTFEHQFNNKGFFDVHVLMNNNIITTYTFRVKG